MLFQVPLPSALLILAAIALSSSALLAQSPVEWHLERLDQIGGLRTNVVGQPHLADSDRGKAIAFDGQDDGVFLPVNPLAGLEKFTAEVIFQPASDGPREQRFVHFQEDGSENRLLFEIRLRDDRQWFLDTFLKTSDGNYTLYAELSPHPLGPWYHAAAVVDGQTMRHYVNGQEELATPIKFAPLKAGQSSLGVRINRVSWYRGAIRRIRVTPRVLAPKEFLRIMP